MHIFGQRENTQVKLAFSSIFGKDQYRNVAVCVFKYTYNIMTSVQGLTLAYWLDTDTLV